MVYVRSGKRVALKLLSIVGFILACIAINLLGVTIREACQLNMIYLDTTGTIVATAIGGVFPGMLTGYITNLVVGVIDGKSDYYCIINVIIALIIAFMLKGVKHKGIKPKILWLSLTVLLIALVGGGLGSVISWHLNKLLIESSLQFDMARIVAERTGFSLYISYVAYGFILDLIDKIISTVVAVCIIYKVPDKWKESLCGQKYGNKVRSVSLHTKIVTLIGLAYVIIAIVSISISSVLYIQIVLDEHKQLGIGVTNIIKSMLDTDKIDTYISDGINNLSSYIDIENKLYAIKDNIPDVQFLYVYKIEEDGCHVVFDLDTQDVVASNPGDIVGFDESFSIYKPLLLAGESVDPIITNDTYGWLLTIYNPMYNSNGDCVCYAAVDISMGQITTLLLLFIVKQLSVFMGFFLVTLYIGFICADYNVVLPINSIANVAGEFAFTNENDRLRSVNDLKQLKIYTGDEIENLYLAFLKTIEDTASYITQVHKQSQMITHMQNGLILVLAEIVESRDLNTGYHVRKTSMYVQIIMEQMKKNGVYSDVLTDEYIDLVVNAAPLHDIGKIHVPDFILNKPGRLTDEEFEQMKKHTLAGKVILTRAIQLVSGSRYLNEARNLATYHHERWDGKGYPSGLSEELIPLSARIMAVADVFDALVSKRSYKEGFPIEKALSIIKEGKGTQFDPVIVDAFLAARERICKAMEEFKLRYESE